MKANTILRPFNADFKMQMKRHPHDTMSYIPRFHRSPRNYEMRMMQAILDQC